MSRGAATSLPAWPSRLNSELDAADRRAEQVARELTAAQLNWQPAPDAWSVGQCLEHLRVANEILTPVLSSTLEGHEPGPVDEISLGWFSAWFLRSFIAPNPGGTRAKAPGMLQPASQLSADVVEKFLRSTADARRLIEKASPYDVNRIRYRNPFFAALRFTVGMGLEIIPKHAARHLLQAEGVIGSEDFPR